MPKKQTRPRYRLYLGTDENGKRQYKSFTADTLRQAKKDARAWAVLRPESASQETLDNVCTRYLETHSDTLSPSTYADYTNRIHYLRSHFPDLFKARIGALTTDRMQELVNALASKQHDRNSAKKLSPKTVYAYYSLLDTILKTNGIHITGVQLPQRQKPELNIPEEDLIKQLLKSVEGTHLEIPVLLAALGPMRRGEICALTMDDIDFDNNIVHVRKSRSLTATGAYTTKAPKSSAGNRDIQYPAEVIEKIRQQGYVTNCNPATLSHNFTRHLERKHLPHFRFHDLRHYSASFLLAMNIPPVYVMRRGGWQSDQTMRRYVHALDKQTKQFEDQASSAFGDLL